MSIATAIAMERPLMLMNEEVLLFNKFLHAVLK
jgi:hypothetical protein